MGVPIVIVLFTMFLNHLHGQPYIVLYVLATTSMTSVGYLSVNVLWRPQCSPAMQWLYHTDWFDVCVVASVVVPMLMSIYFYFSCEARHLRLHDHKHLLLAEESTSKQP